MRAAIQPYPLLLCESLPKSKVLAYQVSQQGWCPCSKPDGRDEMTNHEPWGFLPEKINSAMVDPILVFWLLTSLFTLFSIIEEHRNSDGL